MKRYYNEKEDKFYNGRNIVVGGRMIVNPSEEILKSAGYTEYIAPEPVLTDEEKLEQAKFEAEQKIEDYDRTKNVFSISGEDMWLTFDERSRILASLEAYEALGQETMTKWFNGQAFTFPLDTWKLMLAELEIYASEVLNTTEQHKYNVKQLTNVDDIEAYDYTSQYPNKVMF